MTYLRHLTAALFLCALLATSAFGLGTSCVTPQGHILARLASPELRWSDREVARLTALANLPFPDFQTAIKSMPPLERFRIAAAFLYISDPRSKPPIYAISTQPRKRMGEYGDWLREHLHEELSPNERKSIVTSKHTFGEPFRTDEAYKVWGEVAARRWRDNMSLLLDRVYGLDIERVEKTVPEEMFDGVERGMKSEAGNADWSLRRLSPNSQNTTYSDMEAFFGEAKLQPGQTVVDLGAGYGRMGMYLGAQHPEVKFLGYEINPVRVAAGKKIYGILGFKNAQLLEQDLSAKDFELPVADIYYMYDPVNQATRNILFKKIRARAEEAKAAGKKIKVICREGRGDFHEWLAEQKWLKPTVTVRSGSNVGFGTDDSIIFEAE